MDFCGLLLKYCGMIMVVRGGAMSVAFVGIISLAHEFTSTQVYVIHLYIIY